MSKGMKRKTIESILSRKFNAFVASIEDENVKELVKENTIITGGCIASMLLGEEVNDFDFYFRNGRTTKAVADYFVEDFKRLKKKLGRDVNSDLYVRVDEQNDKNEPERIKIVSQSSGVAGVEDDNQSYQYFETTDPNSTDAYEYANEALKVRQDAEEVKGKYKPIYLTTNAITCSDDVQLIIRFYGEPEEIHRNYDFVHCTNYWDSKTGKLTLRSEAMESLMSGDLYYQGSRYPLCSIFRIRKFLDRGWRISAGEILKIAMNLQEFNLSNPEVLEDQLIGVDVAYFNEVIAKLKEHDPNKVDKTYLVSLLDELF